MSIYISGVEMPKGCGAVTLKVWPDGEVEIIDEDGEWKTTKAIPVSEHGRMVDAELVRDGIIKKWMEKVGDSHAYKCGMEDACEVLRNAPTIIPADPPKGE